MRAIFSSVVNVVEDELRSCVYVCLTRLYFVVHGKRDENYVLPPLCCVALSFPFSMLRFGVIAEDLISNRSLSRDEIPNLTRRVAIFRYKALCLVSRFGDKSFCELLDCAEDVYEVSWKAYMLRKPLLFFGSRQLMVAKMSGWAGAKKYIR